MPVFYKITIGLMARWLSIKKAERYQGATEDALRRLCRKRGESAHGNIHEMRWRINLGIKKLSGKEYVLEDGRTGIASSSNPQRAVAHRHGHEDTSRVAVALQVPPAAGGERTSNAEATLNPLTHQHAISSPHRRPTVAQAKAPAIADVQGVTSDRLVSVEARRRVSTRSF